MSAQKIKSPTYSAMLKTLLCHSVPEITIEQAEQINPALWLDARAKPEFEISHVENALWVGYDDFCIDRVNHIDKNELIIVYCSVGYRSEKIAEKLITAGYSNVHNLYGGLFEWKNQGRAVVDSYRKETDRVHAYNKLWSMWLRKGEKVFD